jgi:Domain of unknown function (DUF4271)
LQRSDNKNQNGLQGHKKMAKCTPHQTGFALLAYLCVMLRWVLIVLLGVLQYAGYAQTTAPAPNPFEIISRLPRTSSGQIASGPANPFDVVPHRIPGATPDADQLKTITTPQALIQLPQGNTLPQQFVFWVLTALTVFFAFAVASNRGAFLRAWRGFLNDTAFNMARREASSFVGNTPYYLMYISFLLNAGLFLFLIISAFHQDRKHYNWGAFFWCMLGVTLLFAGKHLVLQFVGWLFPRANGAIENYNFLIIIFNCVLGFFLIPFNYLVAFGADSDRNLFLALWTVGLAAIFLLYQSIRALSIGAKFLASSQFHFLTYLCVVEIAPIAILVRFFF